MPAAAADIFFVDFLCRPFVKIVEKMPLIMLLILFLLYGVISYFLLRSAYMADHQH